MEDEAWMKSVAGEFNLSETAFVQLQGANGEETKGEAKGGDAAATAPVHASIRWFTPTVEVDLCGHATLGASHMLWDDGHVDIDRDIHFSSNSGLLVAKRRRDPVRYV
jgi:predicted PhzF superfamily epimerase YddE/YHI9